MDNISIAIVSDDAEYNRALSRSLISVSRDLSVTAFGSMQFVSNWNRHRGRKPYYETFDIVLWAGEEIRDAYGDNILFLTDRESDEEIDYTNNISERQLRKFKRKQKQAVVLRSDTGGQHICDALTIIETAKMQKRNVYDAVESAFTK